MVCGLSRMGRDFVSFAMPNGAFAATTMIREPSEAIEGLAQSLTGLDLSGLLKNSVAFVLGSY